MNDLHLQNMNLRSRIISLEKTIEAYRSSKKFEELRHFHFLALKEKEVEINTLKQEIEQDSLHHKKAIREWMRTNEELFKDCKAQLLVKDKEIKRLNEQLDKAYAEMNVLYNQATENAVKIQNVEHQLNEEQGKNAKLKSQVNKNYENSSKPSSACSFRKKIKNSRVSSGKQQGGQKGHQWHDRKHYEPTNIICIEALDEYLDTTKYVATGKIIKKQVVHVSLVTQVDEYQTPEYRCITNRQKVHAPFPKGVSNEMNFGASVQATAFLLTNYYNVSIAKTREFMHQMSGGVLSMSTGCINQLSKKFSQNTEQQRAEIFDQLVKAPVLNTDFTTALVNGKQKQILICSSGDQVMYYARDHKGHKGIADSPVAYSTNTLVHDHEIAFYKYGGKHQECLVHVLRYLLGSIENEQKLSWNKRMHETIRKMIHYAKQTENRDEEAVKRLLQEYDRNLEIAELNYKEYPPTKYYRDGYNLFKRMKEYRDNHILFLIEEGIPYDNNLSERLARVMKRKLKQMTTYRSFNSFSYSCESLGMIETIRMQGGNLFDRVTEIYDV